MRISKIGQRGVHFLYEDGDSPLGGQLGVYLICSERRLFLCDTHLGPQYMEPIKDYLQKQRLTEKPVAVFNSHADWDHVWGNSAFAGSLIIAHETCRQRMVERGLYDLERYRGKFHNGGIELTLPNLTFQNRLDFPDEGVEFFHAPGHTICSSICYDKQDSVMFVGDLVEHPRPVLSYHDLERYIYTLEYIKNHPAMTLVSSHSGIIDRDLIAKNISFIRSVLDPAGDREEKMYFEKLSLILRYEDQFREKVGGCLNFCQYKEEFWGMMGVSYGDLGNEHMYITNTSYRELKAALEAYAAKL